MKSEIIVSEIKKIQDSVSKKDLPITEDMAFNFLVLQFFCYNIKNIDENIFNLKENITDSKNDGGADFVYFDEDENKLILGQNKYSNNIKNNDVVAEIRKLLKTIKDFEEGNTGIYNDKLKRVLTNQIDRLGEENEGNIEIIFSCLDDLNKEVIMSKLSEDEKNCIVDIKIYSQNDIEDKIALINDDIERVTEYKLSLDKPKNYLEYENETLKGVFVNISSKSLQKAYNSYKDKGLFDLNIRKYIRNKAVDDKINETLNKKRGYFWFLNNGLTIACDMYEFDGNMIKLFGFSIVNGGQTTNLIGNYKGQNSEEFFIPCKIIMPRFSSPRTESIFSDIAEATNSQKPIQPKDLKSNSPEMRRLKYWLLKEYKIDLEIKRGQKKEKGDSIIHIKNDEFAQIINSFVLQNPGTSRSNKKALFSIPKKYNAIFRISYEKDKAKKDFIASLISFYKRYLQNVDKLLQSNKLDIDDKNILNNGRQTILGILGIFYMLINNDIDLDILKNDSKNIDYKDGFVYGSFDYREDDIDEKLNNLIIDIVGHLEPIYSKQSEEYTSVSNFFKTDKTYLETILKKFAYSISKKDAEFRSILKNAEILKRT